MSATGCGDEGPIDREALAQQASLPDSTAPEATEAAWAAMQVGDVLVTSVNVHCGVRYLVLYDGPPWRATDVDSDFSDRDLEVVGSVRGEVEMVAPDRLEFRHPKLRATFVPTTGEVSGCE